MECSHEYDNIHESFLSIGARLIRGHLQFTVSLRHEKWYLSIQTEFPLILLISHSDLGTAVGIYVGAVRLAILSDGQFYASLKDVVRPIADKIAILQQGFKHTTKGSYRNRQLNQRINMLHSSEGRKAELKAPELYKFSSFFCIEKIYIFKPEKKFSDKNSDIILIVVFLFGFFTITILR